MVRTIRVLAYGVLLMLVAIVSARADSPTLVNIVVIDVSGSMTGERLETAKRELLEKQRQLPPSVSVIWVMIPFNSKAIDNRTFNAGLDEIQT